MAERTCFNCMYVSCEPGVWLRCLATRERLVPKCANHPQWPGQLHDVPGVPCRNYRAKPAEPPGDIKRIPLGHGQYVLVDAADYEWLNQWKWTVYGHGYAVRQEKGKTIYMHREIMQAPKGMIVDHIDGNPRNSYRRNLRLCTPTENAGNTVKRAGFTSRFKGVFLNKAVGKWCATIQFKGQSTGLGYFADEVEAARAYDLAAVERFGAFARPNFPEEWPLERRKKVHAQWLKPNGRQKDVRPKARRARKPSVKGRRATPVPASRHKARRVPHTHGQNRRRSSQAATSKA